MPDKLKPGRNQEVISVYHLKESCLKSLTDYKPTAFAQTVCLVLFISVYMCDFLCKDRLSFLEDIREKSETAEYTSCYNKS